MHADVVSQRGHVQLFLHLPSPHLFEYDDDLCGKPNGKQPQNLSVNCSYQHVKQTHSPIGGS